MFILLVYTLLDWKSKILPLNYYRVGIFIALVLFNLSCIFNLL